MSAAYRDPTLSPLDDCEQVEELFPRCTPKTTPTSTPSARKANRTLLTEGSGKKKASGEKKRRTKKKLIKKSGPSLTEVAVDNILDLNFGHESSGGEVMKARAAPPPALGLHNVSLVLSPTPPSWPLSQLDETKIPNPHGSHAMPSSSGSVSEDSQLPASESRLKDTKIEIAGGREIYSQSRSRAGRHKTRESKRHQHYPPQDILSGDDSASHYPPHTQTDPRAAPSAQTRLKETVFASEIHSFEYDKPSQSTSHHRPSYETDIDAGGSDCVVDVNVTYDLIDGEFPPPGGGLTVRSEDKFRASGIEPAVSSHELADLLSQSPPVPEESSPLEHHHDSRESMAKNEPRGRANVSGSIAIDEYEGSPRRYRPRHDGDGLDDGLSESHGRVGSAARSPIVHQDSRESMNRPDSSSNSTLSTPSSSVSSKGHKMRKKANLSQQPVAMVGHGGHGAAGASRLPGFPQRVLPANSTPSSSSSKEESPLSDHKSSIEAAHSSPSSSSTTSSKSNSSKRRFKQQLLPSEDAAALISSLPSRSVGEQPHLQPQPPGRQAPPPIVMSSSTMLETESNGLKRDQIEKQAHSGVDANAPATLDPLTQDKRMVVAANSDALLKFDDMSMMVTETGEQDHPSGIPPTTRNAPELYNYQYEFSETRKVLDEFFPETRVPSNSNISPTTVLKATPPPNEFRDLNYTLRRRTTPDPSELPEQESTSENGAASCLTTSAQPHVGVSSLDQPLISIGDGPVGQHLKHGGSSGSVNKVYRNAAPPVQQVVAVMGNNGHNSDTGYATLNSPEAASRVSHHSLKGGHHVQSHRGSDQTNAAFHMGVGGANNCDYSRNFTLSPETTDCDSADLESEVSMNEGSFHSSGPRMHTAMPILEDGLSSGHASDLEEDVIYSSSGSMVLKKSSPANNNNNSSSGSSGANLGNNIHLNNGHVINSDYQHSHSVPPTRSFKNIAPPPVESPTAGNHPLPGRPTRNGVAKTTQNGGDSHPTVLVSNLQIQRSPTAAAHQPHAASQGVGETGGQGGEPPQDRSVAAALEDIKMALQSSAVKTNSPLERSHQPTLSGTRIPPSPGDVPIEGGVDSWPNSRGHLGRRGHGTPVNQATAASPNLTDYSSSKVPPPLTTSELEDNLDDEDEEHEGEDVGSEDDLEDEEDEDEDDDEEEEEEEECEISDGVIEERVPTPKNAKDDDDLDTDQETDRLLGQQYNDDKGYFDAKVWHRPYASRSSNPYPGGPRPIDNGHGPPRPLSYYDPPPPTTPTMISAAPISSLPNSPPGFDPHEDDDIDCPACRLQNEIAKKKGTTTKTKEAVTDPKVLIEGVLFRARYLGSTQLVCEGQPTKATRMMQAEEAVSRIKAPAGENQPSTEVDLFISTEKIMVLNTDLKEIMMDHALRSISYIADIGELLVIMARRRLIPNEGEEVQVIGTTPKMICHVFESEEAQFIAQSIGQAFQVAYMEFLKANGIDDHSFVKEMDYQEVLNSQEIFGDELAMFAKKELQKEVVVPKAKGEILGVVIVESGWGSMLPTIVLANLSPTGPAARCGQLNIGDQIIAINGISLVGLPLSTCQTYIKNTKNKTAVKLTAVSCAPVVEVKIKRPDTKYQLGFSVQNGVICSLLRGGIAERGGVRVGHRIIEINGQSVVAVPHERIVNLLATSVGEITMKTMPTSMFRLLTGQETPLYI